MSGKVILEMKDIVKDYSGFKAVDHVDFSVQVWKQIHEDQKKYFEDQEIVGWFFSQPRISMEATELLEKVHLKHFGGEKVLMLMEPQESEDAFFRYENNTMIRLEGYYLYYEKNTCMQNYMVEKNEKLQSDLTEKYEDKAVKDIRKIITEKTKEEKEKNTVSVFSYAVPVCLAIAVLTVGMNFYRNFQNPGYPVHMERKYLRREEQPVLSGGHVPRGSDVQHLTDAFAGSIFQYVQ